MKRSSAQTSRVVFGRLESLPEIVARGLIRVYKAVVSPYFAGACRFLPSCADYADEAIATHGIVRGSSLTFSRLVRCHPLCAGGHDPVPMRQDAGRRAAGTTEAA